MLAIADQIATAHALQRFTQQRPPFRIVIAQEGLVQATLLLALDDLDTIALVGDLAQRVLARVVHGRGRGHR